MPRGANETGVTGVSTRMTSCVTLDVTEDNADSKERHSSSYLFFPFHMTPIHPLSK